MASDPAPHDTSVTAEYGPELAEIVECSVAPEVGEIDDDRSRAVVEREGESVTVRIDADDPVALRASLNTWLAFLDVAERSAAIADEATKRR